MAPTVSVVISGASGVTLSSANGYKVQYEGLGQPSIRWRRGYASSPWTDGATAVSAVKDQAVLDMRVLVEGTSAANLRTRIDALTDAVSQFTYTVTVTINSQAEVWTADPGDWSLDSESWQPSLVGEHKQIVNVSIPVYPVPA